MLALEEAFDLIPDKSRHPAHSVEIGVEFVHEAQLVRHSPACEGDADLVRDGLALLVKRRVELPVICELTILRRVEWLTQPALELDRCRFRLLEKSRLVDEDQLDLPRPADGCDRCVPKCREG